MAAFEPCGDPLRGFGDEYQFHDHFQGADRIVFHDFQRAEHFLEYFGGDRGQAVVAFTVGGEPHVTGGAAEISEPYFCHTITVRWRRASMYRTKITVI